MKKTNGNQAFKETTITTTQKRKKKKKEKPENQLMSVDLQTHIRYYSVFVEN